MQQFRPTPQTLPQSFRCGNHPDREGVGICVSCRTVICVECSTKIDQMNYCIACLSSARESVAVQPQSAGREAALGIPLLLLGLAGTALIFVLLGFVLAYLRSGVGGVTVGALPGAG